MEKEGEDVERRRECEEIEKKDEKRKNKIHPLVVNPWMSGGRKENIRYFRFV